MQIILPILWLLLSGAGVAYGESPQIERVDITEYGVYTLDRKVQGRSADGINAATATGIRHAATVRTVPMHLGATFGFRYQVVGKPDGVPVQLRNVVVFPPSGLQPSHAAKILSQYEHTLASTIGSSNHLLYTLEDDFELVPGTWVIELWHGKRKLAWQTFQLVTPSGACQGESCLGM